MPLPTSTGQWPPRDVKPYLDHAHAAAAWWTGDKHALREHAHTDEAGNRRRFWNRRRHQDATKATAQIHAPLAADIASVSAALLFSEKVGLTVDNTTVQAQIEQLEETLGLENKFAEAAEIGAAHGGFYFRPAWDTKVADHPLLQVYPHTRAVPDFRYGVLVAVTLWEDVYVDGGEVWRHLERHEPGVILHGLYLGTRESLGTPTSLQAHPSTADLEPVVKLTGRLEGRLLPSYAPNMLPNRHGWKPIGRADWQGGGIEDMLDAVDETWTSLMRDIRLGQAHVFVPQDWLRAVGGKPGSTQTVDVDTELITGVNRADAEDAKMETYQAAIRVGDHVNALLALTERVVSACGYAPQTFGLQIDGQASSGTSLRIREGKTKDAQSKKRRYVAPALAHTTDTLLAIGAEIFHTPAPDDGDAVKVTWPELTRDPAEQADWISTLRTAQAISIENAVRAAQPDLDDDDVTKEVALIKAEQAPPAANPYPEDDLDQA